MGVLLLSLCGNTNAQVLTIDNAGSMGRIPGQFMKSGQSAIYIADVDESQSNISLKIYGKGFSVINNLSIPVPESHSSRKSEEARISLDDITLSENAHVSIRHEVDSITTADSLLSFYNMYAQAVNDYIDEYGEYYGRTEKMTLYNEIATAGTFNFITMILRNGIHAMYDVFDNQIYDHLINHDRTMWHINSAGELCCYPDSNYCSYDYYHYDEHGILYPEYYDVIRNGIVFRVNDEYKSTYYAQLPATIDWRETNTLYSDDDYVMERFARMTYTNVDNSSHDDFYENPFLSQSLFNTDEKYEYILNTYNVGDWVVDDYYYYRDSTFYISSGFNEKYYTIKNYKERFGDCGCSYDRERRELVLRKYSYRDVRQTGFQVVSEDGSVVFTHKHKSSNENARYSDSYIAVLTFNGENYLMASDYDYGEDDNNGTNTITIYEIQDGSASVKAIERVSVPLASARNGVISMKLDDSHTDSNAELVNMSGQTVNSRYIGKGETNPTMSAAGLPDGVYNLILNRNGQTISNQKMLIK